MARFLHLADLHLGRTLHHARLMDDQRFALEGILELIRGLQPEIDAVLIAGDVYDRAIPPAEAITLLNWFIKQLADDLGVQVVMIPGNHDSAVRMGFMAGLTRDIIHIAGPITETPTPLVLQDEHGPIDVFALPFLEPAEVRSITGDETVKDQQTAMDTMVQRMLECSTSGRSVLVAHAFVNDASGSAEESESERTLYVGGSGVIDAQTFTGFDYVALGHLHRPQRIGTQRIQYSGSLMKYSKSEAEHKKSVTLIEMGANGELETTRIPIRLRRDLRVKRGLFEALMADADPCPEDYLFFELENRDPISEVMNRLREKYPNAVHLMYVRDEVDTTLTAVTKQHHEVRIETHFCRFFEEVTGAPLEPDQERALLEVVGELAERLEPSS